jgi:hypothetical protein
MALRHEALWLSTRCLSITRGDMGVVVRARAAACRVSLIRCSGHCRLTKACWPSGDSSSLASPSAIASVFVWASARMSSSNDESSTIRLSSASNCRESGFHPADWQQPLPRRCLFPVRRVRQRRHCLWNSGRVPGVVLTRPTAGARRSVCPLALPDASRMRAV